MVFPSISIILRGFVLYAMHVCMHTCILNSVMSCLRIKNCLVHINKKKISSESESIFLFVLCAHILVRSIQVHWFRSIHPVLPYCSIYIFIPFKILNGEQGRSGTPTPKTHLLVNNFACSRSIAICWVCRRIS